MEEKLGLNKTGTLTKDAQTVKDMQEDFGAGGKYTITQAGNTWILNSNDNTGERFMFVDSSGNYQVLDADQVRSAYVKDAAARGGIDGLRNRLYKAGFMNEVEYKSKDATALNAGIVKAARKITIDAVTKFTDTATPLVSSFDSFLSREAQYNTLGSGPSTGVNMSTRMQADQDIDEFFVEYLGRRATQAEKIDYFNRISKEEKAATKKTTVKDGKQVTVGEYLDQTDYYRIRAEVLKPAVKGTAIEDITAGNGKIAKDVAEIKAYAADYGIKLDTKQALDKVYSGLTPGKSLTTGNLDSQKTAIKETDRLEEMMFQKFYLGQNPELIALKRKHK
jgi:hypothetical protein